MQVRFAPGTDPRLAGGFTKIPNVIMRDPTLSERAKLVYGLLLSFAWEQLDQSMPREAYPGLEKLCGLLGLSTSSRKTVRAALHELEGRGLISTARQGQGATNLYTILPLPDGQKQPHQDGVSQPHQDGAGRPLQDGVSQPHEEDTVRQDPAGQEVAPAGGAKQPRKAKRAVQQKPAQDPAPEKPQPQTSTPPATVTAPAPEAPKKPPTWAGLQYPKLLKICPEYTAKEGFPLLNRLAKQYTQDTVTKAVDELLGQGDEIGVAMMYPVLTNQCKRVNEAKIVRRGSRGAAPVSESNARNMESYLPPKENSGG